MLCLEIIPFFIAPTPPPPPLLCLKAKQKQLDLFKETAGQTRMTTAPGAGGSRCGQRVYLNQWKKLHVLATL